MKSECGRPGETIRLSIDATILPIIYMHYYDDHSCTSIIAMWHSIGKNSFRNYRIQKFPESDREQSICLSSARSLESRLDSGRMKPDSAPAARNPNNEQPNTENVYMGPGSWVHLRPIGIPGQPVKGSG